MKLFIAKLVAYILFLGLIFVAVLVVTRITLPNINRIRYLEKLNVTQYTEFVVPSRLAQVLKEIKEKDEIDLVFIGSSRAIRAYDTRFFDEKGYFAVNLGTTHQSPYNTFYLLKDFLEKHTVNKIVFDIYPELFRSDGISGAKRILLNTRNPKVYLPMLRRTASWETYLAFLISCFDLHRFEKKDFKIDQPLERYIAGGYIENEESYFFPSEVRLYNHSVQEYQVRAFEQCLSLIKEKGIDAAVVISPACETLYNATEGYDIINSKIQKITHEYGFTFYDFNNKESRNTLYYSDPFHMNKTGVEKYLPRFYEEMRNQGFLK